MFLFKGFPASSFADLRDIPKCSFPALQKLGCAHKYWNGQTTLDCLLMSPGLGLCTIQDQLLKSCPFGGYACTGQRAGLKNYCRGFC